jgi:hypothetical protein
VELGDDQMSDSKRTVADHARDYFNGHDARMKVWPRGPMVRSHPGFNVLEFAPGPRSGFWNYVSVGAVEFRPPNDTKLEFLLCADRSSERAVELVTMAAWYHETNGLGLGHTLPIGEGWVPGASCDHFLISLPYPYGPELEVVPSNGERARIAWLLPITGAERDYAATHGPEALEGLFQSNSIEYWAPDRPSVVFDGTG